MNAIRNVFAALSNLAGSLNSLAAVINGARDRLQQQLAFDADTPPLLEQQNAGDTEADTAQPAKRGRKGS